MATTEREYEDLVRRMADELNAHNVDALDEILTPDHVCYTARSISEDNPQGIFTNSREEYKEGNARNREKWPDLARTLMDIFVAGNEILERTKTTVTWNEEEMAAFGFSKAGEFAYNANRLHRVEDGRLAEYWEILVPIGTPTDSAQKEYEDLVRRMADELNDHNVDALDEILAPDWVYHSCNTQQEETREEYKKGNARRREEHEHWTQTVKDIYVDVEDGDIFERTQLTGTMSEAEVAESPWHDEREFTHNMNRRHRIEDGRIAETWELQVPTEHPDE